ncbi:hypothetical protein [Saccharothrix sp. NRRL B-16348]|uniref:hypothetical protein n=1 Tax=Saccharothrix sp. NRRL B-16348 TaxID=1415542 RepID=UPI001E53DFA8|nr:hypothetical protein [Saccharothrix sp. NRRL B-16348]
MPSSQTFFTPGSPERRGGFGFRRPRGHRAHGGQRAGDLDAGARLVTGDDQRHGVAARVVVTRLDQPGHVEQAQVQLAVREGREGVARHDVQPAVAVERVEADLAAARTGLDRDDRRAVEHHPVTRDQGEGRAGGVAVRRARRRAGHPRGRGGDEPGRGHRGHGDPS